MRIIYNEYTKEIIAIIEEEQNSVTAYPPGSGVIQGSAQTCYLQGLAIGVDVSTLIGGYVLSDREKLIARLTRCRNVKLRFLEENLSVTISPEQSAQLLGTFINVMLLLDAGDAKTALGALIQMPDLLFPITKIGGSTSLYESSTLRKESYVAELLNIVTDLFE